MVPRRQYHGYFGAIWRRKIDALEPSDRFITFQCKGCRQCEFTRYHNVCSTRRSAAWILYGPVLYAPLRKLVGNERKSQGTGSNYRWANQRYGTVGATQHGRW